MITNIIIIICDNEDIKEKCLEDHSLPTSQSNPLVGVYDSLSIIVMHVFLNPTLHMGLVWIQQILLIDIMYITDSY